MQDAWEPWAELVHSVEGQGLCWTGTLQRACKGNTHMLQILHLNNCNWRNASSTQNVSSSSQAQPQFPFNKDSSSLSSISQVPIGTYGFSGFLSGKRDLDINDLLKGKRRHQRRRESEGCFTSCRFGLLSSRGHCAEQP
ncbi:hypothetical protein E5288_WYG002158 [Bos mutus]|uniref:Uncharacterized protein n=1 Tax=Bos mutus TaxID=72004 RepID=A0A6B0S6L3_9CETA|nr:hypothetical protein [Bos mutus]